MIHGPKTFWAIVFASWIVTHSALAASAAESSQKTSSGITSKNTVLDFFTNGTSIDGWIRYPNLGYDISWHFAKENENQSGWYQELAVKYYDRDVIDFYDVSREREFKGYYDLKKGKYFRLSPKYRRYRVEEIQKNWGEELEEMPFIHDMFKTACEPFAKSGPRLSTPPDPLETPKEWLEKHSRK